MRLIDADALKKRAVKVIGIDFRSFKAVSTGDINHAPTIDAVPVVRCKGCKHYKEINGKSARMACFVHLLTPHPMLPDDFCSRGERKDGE